MSPETLVSYANKRGIAFRLDSGRLKAVAERELTEKEKRLLREHREAIRAYLQRGEPAPEATAPPATAQGVSPELWEIREALLFNGGACAARLLVAVCRLSHSVKEIEVRLREGETLGLWERTERTDALGFLIWALLT